MSIARSKRKIKEAFFKSCFNFKLNKVLKENINLINVHQGKRCFIIGTGSSLKSQDLKLLQGEFCIAMSQLYNHEDYNVINPEFHMFSGIVAHSHIPEEVGIKYYQEIEQKVKNTTNILINYKDYDFIQTKNLLPKHKVNFLSFIKKYKNMKRAKVRMDKPCYESQCVAVMALQAAISMGFKEIYLLGLDHDWILRMKDKIPAYFYNPQETFFGKNGIVENWADGLTNWEAEFASHLELWQEYRKLDTYAKKHNINIYNATAGGILDVFPRVHYESLF